jgi:hypothetical protein
MIRRKALKCNTVGLSWNLAHIHVAYSISGLEAVRYIKDPTIERYNVWSTGSRDGNGREKTRDPRAPCPRQAGKIKKIDPWVRVRVNFFTRWWVAGGHGYIISVAGKTRSVNPWHPFELPAGIPVNPNIYINNNYYIFNNKSLITCKLLKSSRFTCVLILLSHSGLLKRRCLKTSTVLGFVFWI